MNEGNEAICTDLLQVHAIACLIRKPKLLKLDFEWQ